DSGTWQAEDFGTSLPVPSFVWDIPESGGTYIGAHVAGAEAVDGVETHVLTFFLDLPQTPVWFRLWSDTTGLVHRASMRAQGHFVTTATPTSTPHHRSSHRSDEFLSLVRRCPIW